MIRAARAKPGHASLLDLIGPWSRYIGSASLLAPALDVLARAVPVRS